MNNLLSNVLVAAWQTTQSVTTGAQLCRHLTTAALKDVPWGSASPLIAVHLLCSQSAPATVKSNAGAISCTRSLPPAGRTNQPIPRRLLPAPLAQQQHGAGNTPHPGSPCSLPPAGRINQSMSRMLHAHAMANTGDGGAGTPATACSHSQAPVQQGGDNVSPSSGSPASNRVLGKPPSVRGVGRSMASMTALGLTPKVRTRAHLVTVCVVGGLVSTSPRRQGAHAKGADRAQQLGLGLVC